VKEGVGAKKDECNYCKQSPADLSFEEQKEVKIRLKDCIKSEVYFTM
jgi:hypothetical protein